MSTHLPPLCPSIPRPPTPPCPSIHTSTLHPCTVQVYHVHSHPPLSEYATSTPP
ncbi:unnamed protein product [Staurois parvus]|uniref:Uncharacterized protein n=1 Tax=Staurois parvus TaxID=386267 RepID=A0ABN9CBI8_9NEOB|nr:unnamed protein product [Staurois parvus]